MLVDGALELGAVRREVGELCGELREGLLRRRERRLGSCLARRDFTLALGAALRLLLQAVLFPGEPLKRQGRLGDVLLLALAVLGELDEAALELSAALLGARLLAIERIARDHQPVQRGRSPGFGVAQGWHGGSRERLVLGGFRLDAG